MNFSKNIKLLRKEKALTQTQLGEILGKTKTTICDWEHAKVEPDIATLIKLADLFECTTDYLLGRENETGLIIVHKELSKDQRELLRAYDKADRNTKAVLNKVIAAFSK